jgi:hypothetical protein
MENIRSTAPPIVTARDRVHTTKTTLWTIFSSLGVPTVTIDALSLFRREYDTQHRAVMANKAICRDNNY